MTAPKKPAQDSENVQEPPKFATIFTTQTAVVQLGNGNSVTLRKLSYGDRQDAIAKATTHDPETNNFITNFALLQLWRLVYSIVHWTGPDVNGIGIDFDTISSLDPEVADYLNEQYRAAFQGDSLTTDEGKG